MLRNTLAVLLIMACSISLAQNSSLLNYLQSLDNDDLEFKYRASWIADIRLVNISSDPLENIEASLEGTGFEYLVHRDRYLIIYPNRIKYESLLNRSVEDVNESDFVVIGNPDDFDPNRVLQLSGRVSNKDNEPVIGATVHLKDLSAGIPTDGDGRYTLELPPGNHKLFFRYTGLEEESRVVTLYNSGNLDITLFQDSYLLDEVIVEDYSLSESFSGPMIGKKELGIREIEFMPRFMGEVDIIKSSTLLPGVNTAGESSAYLNVRGGKNDQTLILMNGAPIFTPGHLLGFFSVFNPAFVSSLSLYKGNIPAQFGTRASSVLDVKLNRKAKKPFSVYGGLGLINSNLGVKAKAFDDKLDIHIGGRATYSDWLFSAARSEQILKSSARFGDMNAVINYQLNEKNSFQTSSFWGTDYFEYNDQIIYEWDAINNNTNWDHLISKNLLNTLSFSYSSLKNKSESIDRNDLYDLRNSIRFYGLSNTLNVSLNESSLDVGVSYSDYEINPGNIAADQNLFRDTQELDLERLVEVAGFLDYTAPLGDRFEVNAALRFVSALNVGPTNRNLYQRDAPINEENVAGVETFGKGEVNARFYAIEPRLGLAYQIDDNNSLKFGFSRTNQLLHLVSNTTLVNPVSFWKAIDKFVEPTRIDQYSIGYTNLLPFLPNASFSIEGYYKSITDLLDYKDGADLQLNENLEQVTIRGEGESYGVEFLLQANTEKLNGALSYTYSRSFIKANGRFEEETINDGEKYPYYTDRPHNLRTNLDYKLTKKWSIGLNYVFVSGGPVSAPANAFLIDDITVPYFPERNNARIPNYSRLDLSITLRSRIRRTKKNKDRWVLSLYNVLARKNPSSIFFSRDGELPAQSFQLIAIDTVVPTITYKFEF